MSSPNLLMLRRGGIVLVVLLACALAAGLLLANRSGGRPAPVPQLRVVGVPAPGPFSIAPYSLPASAARAARMFFTGYLAYRYGHRTARQIQAASAGLIASFPRGLVSISAAGRRLHPQVVRLGASETKTSVLHVTALIADGAAQYPIRVVMADTPQGWETTQVVDPE